MSVKSVKSVKAVKSKGSKGSNGPKVETLENETCCGSHCHCSVSNPANLDPMKYKFVNRVIKKNGKRVSIKTAVLLNDLEIAARLLDARGIDMESIKQSVDIVNANTTIREYVRCHDSNGNVTGYSGCLIGYKDVYTGKVVIGYSSCDKFDQPGSKDLASIMACVSSCHYPASKFPIPYTLSPVVFKFIARCSSYFHTRVDVLVKSHCRHKIITMSCDYV